MSEKRTDTPHYARSDEYRARRAAYMRMYRASHPGASTKFTNAWAKANPERNRELKRRYELKIRGQRKWLWARYRIRPEQWQEMFDAQSGRCAICNYEPSGVGRDHLAVDHDHETGAVRGLLCQLCNRGIGQLHDDENVLYAAAEYLSRHKRPILTLVA